MHTTMLSQPTQMKITKGHDVSQNYLFSKKFKSPPYFYAPKRIRKNKADHKKIFLKELHEFDEFEIITTVI